MISAEADNGESDALLDLVTRACAGDRDAFSHLQAKYAKAITGFARARLANDADAQDLAQETWLQVWQKLPTYDPARGSFVKFVRYWAGVMALRFYDRRDRRHGVEVLVPDVGDHAAPQDEASPPLAVFAELLQTTFASSSPPHQLIAFGVIKCLGWTPRRAAAELSDMLLDECETRLEQGYLDASSLPDQHVRPTFAALRDRLRLRFGDAVTDPKTQSTYPHLLDRVVGETCLRVYYTGDDPTTDLTQWWYAVLRRVRGELQRRTEGPVFELASARAARKAAMRRISIGESTNAGR